MGDGSARNRELQYEIQFVKVSTTRQFVSESLKYNIITNLKENITAARKRFQLQISSRKVKRLVMWNTLVCIQNQVQMKVVYKGFSKQLEVGQFVFVLSVMDVCTSQMLYYLTKKSTT